MREYLVALSDHVLARLGGRAPSAAPAGVSPGGDAQFEVDDVAEGAVREFVEARGRPLAVYSEAHGLWTFGDDPDRLLVVDPIDGTRPFAAGFEMATFSVAAAPLTDSTRIADVDYALVRELATGALLYADRTSDGLVADGYGRPVPALRPTTDTRRMFWSFEFNGHPAELMTASYGHLIDRSANTGGVFLFNSASYSITRIVTGQLDAYVDIGNRLLADRPELRPEFERVGNGAILHLFPYDIAASVLIAERGGVVITDAYGRPLGDTELLSIEPANQQSCVAASTPELHAKLLEEIRW